MKPHSGPQKTNPNKANFKCPQTHQRSGKKKGYQELFLGLNFPRVNRILLILCRIQADKDLLNDSVMKKV
jgi:hypothetical protein